MDLNSVVTLAPDQSIADFACQVSSEIMNKYEKTMLYHITEKEFPLSSQESKNQIFEIAVKNASPNDGEIKNAIHYNRRKALIEESVVDYLSENKSIILSGFMNFRLSDYKNELYDICINAGEEYAAIKEYNEFIDMLRFFISVQTPREDLVHIVKDDGEWRILNRRRRDITESYTNDLPHFDEELTGEDILLSALIAIVPRRIIVHDEEENAKIYETIKLIFEDVRFNK